MWAEMGDSVRAQRREGEDDGACEGVRDGGREGARDGAQEGGREGPREGASEGGSDRPRCFMVALVGALGLPLVGTLVGGMGSWAAEALALVSIPRAFFMVFLIVLVTTVSSMRHTIAAVRHRDCQTQDHMREGKAGLFCSSAAAWPPYPGGGRAASCPSLTLHYLPGVCPVGCCSLFWHSQRKGFWKWAFLPVTALPKV